MQVYLKDKVSYQKMDDLNKMLDGVTAIIRLERGEYATAIKRLEAAKEAMETDTSVDAYRLVAKDLWDQIVKLELTLPARDEVPLAFLIKPIAILRVRKENFEKMIAEEEATIADLAKEHSWKWSGSKGVKRESAQILAHRGIIATAQEFLIPINKELAERDSFLRKRAENQLYIDALSLAAKGEGPVPQRYLDEQEAKRQVFLKENPAWVPTGPYASEKIMQLSAAKNMAAAV